MIELLKEAPDDFVNETRGMIDMKGKGPIPTYWLTAAECNQKTNKEALKSLDQEVCEKFKDMLKQENIMERKKATVKEKKQTPAATQASTASVESSSADDEVDVSGSSYASSTTDFNDSSTSLSMPSPMGVSNRSAFAPSKNELLHMLGQFLDGENYEDLTGSKNLTGSSGEVPLSEVVGGALRLMDGDN